jgi:sialate O-acetylesterase
MKYLTILLLSLLSLHAEVRLPGFFNDHMVLQRDKEVPIWGWAEVGEQVTIEFAAQKQTTTADKYGMWKVTLQPLVMNAKGSILKVNQVVIKDILVGDVWLTSGTKSMDMPVRKCYDVQQDIKEADLPQIRYASVVKAQSPLPENDAVATWQICQPEAVKDFSAISYFFAQKVHQESGVPIGILNASWSGTGINPWIPAEGYRDTPELKFAVKQIYDGRPSSKVGQEKWQEYLKELKAWIPKARQAIANNELPTDKPEIPTELWITNIVPTKTFNGMINPLVTFAIHGVLWAEGENHSRRSKDYFFKKKGLVDSWRKLWGQGEFPFYYAQLTNDGKYSDDPKGGGLKAEVREVQEQFLETQNTAMVITTDIGTPENRFIFNKQDIGKRFARIALAKEYGKSDTVHRGPSFKDFIIKENQLHIQFNHIGNGLMVGKKDGVKPVVTSEESLKGFAIAGADQKWYWAHAKVSADVKSIILSSDKVSSPVAVRYAYQSHPAKANLYNKDGLPAVPFRSDEW